jgi:hypothetical protein
MQDRPQVLREVEESIAGTRGGLLKFNGLCEMVREQRASEMSGDTVDNYLMNWCHEEAGMLSWEDGQMMATQGEDGVEDEEDDVEAMGECDIYQV